MGNNDYVDNKTNPENYDGSRVFSQEEKTKIQTIINLALDCLRLQFYTDHRLPVRKYSKVICDSVQFWLWSDNPTNLSENSDIKIVYSDEPKFWNLDTMIKELKIIFVELEEDYYKNARNNHFPSTNFN